MRRYAVLLVAVLVAGVLLATFGRAPRRAAPAAEPVADSPAAEISIGIGERGVEPAQLSIVLGTRVRLTLENRTAHAAVVALAGYEDRLTIGALAPRGRWTGEFTADRPGDDFAWLVNGVPAGRLSVAGSHLVEGHR